LYHTTPLWINANTDSCAAIVRALVAPLLYDFTSFRSSMARRDPENEGLNPTHCSHSLLRSLPEAWLPAVVKLPNTYLITKVHICATEIQSNPGCETQDVRRETPFLHICRTTLIHISKFYLPTAYEIVRICRQNSSTVPSCGLFLLEDLDDAFDL
jgi:hypothetical protein